MTTDTWEAVIGLEVHAQLKTRSKFLTACPVAGGSTADLAPNTFIDPVVLALPGTLPVPNAEAIALATRLGLALSCTLNRHSILARKHYFYPDLPKGYQTSQYETPICSGGAVPVPGLGQVPLTRIHLEEDAGKTIHDPRRNESQVDLNRAGVPLVEIVSEPALHSAEDAVAYLKALHRIVTWYDVCDGDMEAGNFRCDANVSVRKKGGPLGTRTEIKNVNSFKFVGLAIASEIKRQIELLESGAKVTQETRGWDENRGQTRSLRSKEDAHDYRYFPDPDLCPLTISDATLAAQYAFLEAHDLAKTEAELQTLTGNDTATAFFTASHDHLALARSLQRAGATAPAFALFMEVVPRLLNDGSLAFADLAARAESLIPIATALAANTLSRNNARQALTLALTTSRPVDELLRELGGQVSDEAALIAMIEPVLDQNASQVADYLGGKDKLFGFFVGQVMKLAKGKADAEKLNRVLRERLESRRQT